jgi:hypothetical protein
MKIKEHLSKVLLILRPWLISILLATAVEYYSFGESFKWSITTLRLFIISIMVRAAIHWLAVINRAYQHVPDEYCMPASEDSTVRVVVFQLRRRAARLRLVARFTLFLILITLVGGLYTFGWAEQIAAKAQLERKLSLQSDVQETQDYIISLKDRIRVEEDPSKKKFLEEQLNGIQSRLAHLESLSRYDSARSTSQSDSTYLVSVVSTKLGSALILLFLVQILVTLYRYNVRFASFCDSRADVLQLLTTSQHIPMEKVVALLAPDKLDFGKTPPSPVQNAIDIAKEIASFRGK